MRLLKNVRLLAGVAVVAIILAVAMWPSATDVDVAFVSRGAMDIVGLGTRIVEKLIETGKVKDVADIYTLKRADILEAVTKKDRKTEKEPPGKIAENLLASIEASRSRSLGRLIAALGIRGVGDVSANDLARHFIDLDALAKARAEDLEQLDRGRAVVDAVKRIAATMACHAAVKANYPLTAEKMAHILEELCQTAYSTICPHGRPVMLRLTRREVEKNFERI